MVSVRPRRGFIDRDDSFTRSRSMLVRRLTSSAERYGFPFWETPTVEAVDALLGGGESEAVKQIFYVKSPDDGQMDLGLRFDLTIPFARHAAGLIRSGHPLPLRRAETGLVYRADKPGVGRFRQFTQFDVDILGSPSPWAELEILSMLHFALGEHNAILPPIPGLSIYTKVSSRRFLDALLDSVGIDEPQLRLAVIRVIDKMEKLESRDILLELTTGRIDEESGAEIPGVGVARATAEQVLERVVNLRGHPSREDSLNAAANYVKSEQGEQAIQELADFSGALNSVGLSDRDIEFDLSLARGLDYYTGLVFEVRNRGDERTSIAAGGRYDDLLARFSDISVSGTGISIGIDRIADRLLAETDAAATSLSARKILLGLPGVEPTQLQIVANKIRTGGVDIELHVSESGTSLRKQLAYANKGEYAFAVLVGREELNNGAVSVKDLRQDRRAEAELSRAEYRALGTQTQQTLGLDEAIAFLAAR